MRHSFILIAFFYTVTALAQDVAGAGSVSPAESTSQSPTMSSPQSGTPAPANPQDGSYGSTSDSVDASQASDKPVDSPVLKTRQPPPRTIPSLRTVEVGTEMHATLDKVLSTKSSKDGDEFTATLTESLKNRKDEVIVPAGTKIIGKVAESEKGKIFGSVRNSTARLSLRFTGLQLADERIVPLEASLLNIEDTNGKVHAKTADEGGVSGTTNGKDVAKDIGIGAGLGTVAGLALGSALKGLALGALVGGGYVLATQGRDVELPVNTGLHLRLDQHLTLPIEAITGQENAPQGNTTRQ